MPRHRVIAIDPAPAKPSTVYDGKEYLSKNPEQLRKYINQISGEGPETLVCWDAPLTGPTDPDCAGFIRYDFTKRLIERFFSVESTGFKTPKGISVLGYGACPHWTISRSLLGLPRVGSFDTPEGHLPFHLITGPGNRDRQRPGIVEIHPALAAWLWCRDKRARDANWVYKGSGAPKPERMRVWKEMWEIILQRANLPEDLRHPRTDDEFDAAVGYTLGALFIRDEAGRREPCVAILGNARDGAFLVPYERDLFSAWSNWSGTQRQQVSARPGY